MTNTAAHNEKVENFVRAEIFMERVENRELERINDAADCVDDTACKQPSECCVRKRVPKRPVSKHY